MKKLSASAVVLAALALSSVALASQPSGTFKRNVHTKALGGAVNGTWTVNLYRGQYTVTDNGVIVLRGRYSIKGNRITVGGGGKNTFCQVSGVYSFRLSGNSLTFTRISDPTKKCQGRVDVLTNGPFARVR